MKTTLTVLACFLAASAGAVEPSGFQFEGVKPGEKEPGWGIKVEVKGDAAVFDFHAVRGIGGVRIIPKTGVWTKSVILRFRLGGLESLRLSGGGLILSTSVLSHSGHKKLLEIEDGEKKRVGERDDPLWVGIRILDGNGTEIEALPDPAKGGCFEVTVPPALLTRAKTGLTLNWVDFYR